MLIRAGADMPSLDRLERDEPLHSMASLFPQLGYTPGDRQHYQILQKYLKKVFLSGSGGVRGTFATYEKAHRARLAKTFARLSA